MHRKKIKIVLPLLRAIAIPNESKHVCLDFLVVLPRFLLYNLLTVIQAKPKYTDLKGPTSEFCLHAKTILSVKTKCHKNACVISGIGCWYHVWKCKDISNHRWNNQKLFSCTNTREKKCDVNVNALEKRSYLEVRCVINVKIPVRNHFSVWSDSRTGFKK